MVGLERHDLRLALYAHAGGHYNGRFVFSARTHPFMRTSKLLLATVKETPADADVISQKLMLRAGMIRKLAAGLYTWLPMGLRVLRKVAAIVREEMDRSA